MEVNWTEAFDLSLEYHDEGRMQFIAGLTNQYIQHNDVSMIILDVGCGSGKYTSEIHDENKHSLFIGLDLKGVQIAKRNNASNEHSEFIVASLYNLPFREQAFDGG